MRLRLLCLLPYRLKKQHPTVLKNIHILLQVVRKGNESDPFFEDDNGRTIYKSRSGPISHKLYRAEKILDREVVNVSGAGDCFASGFITAMLKCQDEASCIDLAFKCSEASLRSPMTVPEKF